jgi:hypothetical protein
MEDHLQSLQLPTHHMCLMFEVSIIPIDFKGGNHQINFFVLRLLPIWPQLSVFLFVARKISYHMQMDTITFVMLDHSDAGGGIRTHEPLKDEVTQSNVNI